jgi:hypothetical protein
MKKDINKIIALLLGMLLMVSCDEEAVKPVVDITGANSVSPALTNAATGSGELSLANANETFETFIWSAASYGQDLAVSYSLEMDVTEAFTSATTLKTTEDLSVSVTQNDVNNTAILLEMELLKEGTAYFRVVSKINGVESLLPLQSSVVSRIITPYETLIDYPKIYLPGAYQGWNPAGDDAGNLYSYDFNNKYENILYFDDAYEFKITVGQSWDLNYGGSGGVLEQNGANFSVPAAGAYLIKADIGALTYSIEAVDYWGLIGSATPGGWDSDTDMTYNGQRQMWEVTTDLVAGEFKFRANDGWDLNYGDSGTDGSLDANGDNIQLSSDGNYTIRLDITNNTYSVIKN